MIKYPTEFEIHECEELLAKFIAVDDSSYRVVIDDILTPEQLIDIAYHLEASLKELKEGIKYEITK